MTDSGVTLIKKLALALLPELLLRPLRARHYTRVVREFTDAEEPDMVVVRKLVEPGAIALDIGANIGIYTRLLSELCGSGGRVVSVEPVPDTFGFLSRNIRELGLSNVTPVNAAASSNQGTVRFEIPEFSSGGRNYYGAHVVAEDGHSLSKAVVVSTVRLDDLVAVGDKVDFVKCDVEGHEVECLAGAQRLLAQVKPAWMIELWGNLDSDDRAKDCVSLFRDHGYEVWRFSGGALSPRQPGQVSDNYFMLQQSHVSRLTDRAPDIVLNT